MSDLMLHDIPEGDLEILRALAEERHQSLQDLMLEVIREQAMSASNRVKLSVIEARLKRERPEPIPMEVIIAAKNDRD
ncbi:hypothetical protein [Glycomyces albidus]|uniref:Antitoxin n=1 Tax=Glycomyces albidus TaxID=2656774 RepID=A0A6L5GDC6_9ACTN|nr:hypothetical protein [Glycomyces albidus]MQM27707.1 hypothetical protein [Glycomyces albidus]